MLIPNNQTQNNFYINFYLQQLERRKSGEKFDGGKEIVQLFGKKPGQFIEKNVIPSIFNSLNVEYENEGKNIKIKRTDLPKRYTADGFIPALDCYVESKMFSFNSGGTASEKLLYFFVKASRYDKRTLLIFGGEHELLNTGSDLEIWNAYHKRTSGNPVIDASIEACKEYILDIVLLSQLPQWIVNHVKMQ